MKKAIKGLALFMLLLIGYNVSVSAATAPSKIETATATEITEYISGYRMWVLTTKDEKEFVFCETANVTFPRYKTLTKRAEVDKGFVYILRNRPNTGNSNRNFYVTQSAVYWYMDILIGGHKNFPENYKTKCTNERNTNEVCGMIYHLVQGAKNYKEPKGTLSFGSANVTFSESGSYFVSSPITITSNHLKVLNNVKLVGAPSGSTIINSNINNNNGTFQVRVPVSSVAYGSTISFKVSVDGSYSTYSAFDYIYDSNHQTVIYDKLFETPYPISVSKSMSLTKKPAPTTTTTTTTTKKLDLNSLSIKKLDQDGKVLRNAVLTLYKGDCLATACSSSAAYASWTTTGSDKVFTNIPVGYYTIVETTAPEGYTPAEKGLIHVGRADTNYSYSVVNVRETETKPVKISKTDITGTKEIPGATLMLRDSSGKLVESWVSTSSPKYITLPAGEYSLIEQYAPEGYKLNLETITFKVDKAGNVYSKDESGEYVLVEYVRMVNAVNNKISINKLDVNTNKFLPGAVLEIRNEKGEVVATWTTTSESYNISLNQGDYTIREINTPKGYNVNNEVVYFKVFDDGTVMVKNASGLYESVGGIIIYNKPEEEYEIVVEVPKTGLSSTLTYIVGTMTLIGGSLMLKQNGKFN